MDFEWDSAKELSNRKKHGVDFRTAAKVFLDPLRSSSTTATRPANCRFNAIGMVDGRLLFVAYGDERREHPHHIRPRRGGA